MEILKTVSKKDNYKLNPCVKFKNVWNYFEKVEIKNSKISVITKL